MAALAAPKALAGTVSALERPLPPLELTPDEADEWRAVVDGKPADWFDRPMHALLVQHCRHVVCARRIASLIDQEMSRSPLDPKMLGDLMAMQARETKEIASCLTKMRATQQSKYGARGADGASARATVSRPWE